MHSPASFWHFTSLTYLGIFYSACSQNHTKQTSDDQRTSKKLNARVFFILFWI
jgi:hypothetical protein